MRELKITHYTEYCYAETVTLGPHRLLLRPREGADVHIQSSALTIFPEHAVNWHRDVFDNAVAVVDFFSPTQSLTITSEVILRNFGENPLDFLIEDYAVNYPFNYSPQEEIELRPFLLSVYPDDALAIRSWLERLGLSGVSMQTYGLLDLLNRAISNQFIYFSREEPGVQSPAQTLSSGTGSCRDFAALFVETCRSLGLASRFVSGYTHAPTREYWSATTHAWAEVYLPGAGWKGFDPTGGEISAERHIPVAVARDPETISPVAGSFWGMNNALPSLRVDVRVIAL